MLVIVVAIIAISLCIMVMSDPSQEGQPQLARLEF
jgi:hypothetical protein